MTLGEAATSVPFSIAEIFPSSMTTFRSSTAAAPVPSITLTCANTTFAASTRTNCSTFLEGLPVCAAAGSENINTARKEKPKCRILTSPERSDIVQVSDSSAIQKAS